MKIMQIKGNLVWWDASPVVTSLEDAATKYAPDIHFVEAPDYVHEGWGYDPSAEGDARFLRPIPPEGYLYDDATGTFYPASDDRTEAERLEEAIATMRTMLAHAEAQLAALTGGGE